MTSIFGGGSAPAATPPMPAIQQAPPPAMMPGTKPKTKSQQTTFLGAETLPDLSMSNIGGKTLLGM